jgi:hypothetical protein
VGGDLALDERFVQRRQRPPVIVGFIEATVLRLDDIDTCDRNPCRIPAKVVRFPLENPCGERLQQRRLAHTGWTHQQHQERRTRVRQDLAQLSVDADKSRMCHAIGHEPLEPRALLAGQARKRVGHSWVPTGTGSHQR